jgi:hypothetical protein
MPIQNQKADRLLHSAASLLGMPEDQIVGGSQINTFRRCCVAYLLCELGVDRKDVVVAMARSASWLDEALVTVRERVSSSSPFKVNLSAMLSELRLNSPVTSRFREIRKVLSNQGGHVSPDALSITTAMLTLADFISAAEVVE